MPFKSVFERNSLSIILKVNTTDLKIWESSNGRFDWLFNLFSQSKRPLELSHIFKSVMFGNDRLRMWKSVYRCEVVVPAFVLLPIFFCFGSCRDLSSSEAYTGSLWKGKLLGFQLVETFFVNIKAFWSYDQFNTTT
jgi:hypothetical protein